MAAGRRRRATAAAEESSKLSELTELGVFVPVDPRNRRFVASSFVAASLFLASAVGEAEGEEEVGHRQQLRRLGRRRGGGWRGCPRTRSSTMPAGIVAMTNRSEEPRAEERRARRPGFGPAEEVQEWRRRRTPRPLEQLGLDARELGAEERERATPTDHASTETSATRSAASKDPEGVTSVSSASEGSARGGARVRALLGRHRTRDRAVREVCASSLRARSTATGPRRERAERARARHMDPNPVGRPQRLTPRPPT